MWYLNRATGYLYYIPRAGENLATATIVLPLAERLIDASGGSLTTPIHNIIFSGLTLNMRRGCCRARVPAMRTTRPP